MNSPGKIFPPLLHLQYVLQPSANAPGLLLHATHGPALPLLAGAQHLITDQEEVIRACWAPVPVWAVAVGPVMGPPARSKASGCEGSVHSHAASDGTVEVLSADEASGGKEDVLDSANEADISQGSMSLLDISAADDEDTCKCKACELAHKSDTDFVAWRDKLIHDWMTGIQEHDSTVNDYADAGKRRPKNPDTIAPPPPPFPT